MLVPFGAGRLYVQRTDIVAATPLEFGILQECQRSFAFNTKPLMGQNQFAVFVARGAAKWTVKAKYGVFSARAMNDGFFGQALTTGQIALAAGEAGTVPAVTTFTITVANSATFVADRGVVYTNGGLPLVNVPSAPTIGQYSYAAGVYTFAAADANAAVLISYQYTIAATGSKITITQQLMGTTPFFSGVFRNRDAKSGLFSTMVLNRLTTSKLNLASKLEDFEIPEFDMEVMADDSGNIGTMSYGDSA